MPTDFAWAQALRESPIFLVLVGCSIVTLGVACERLWYFWRRNADADALLARLIAGARAGRVGRDALAIHPHPFAAVADRLLESDDPDPVASEERIQIALSEQKLLFERNLGIMATMAAVAPLIGLLGTVWGIMRAFSDMARIGSASPSVVAAGVAEALITTAAGLVVAVPAVMLYNHLTRRMNTALTVAENHTRALRAALRTDAPASDRSDPPAEEERRTRPSSNPAARPATAASTS